MRNEGDPLADIAIAGWGLLVLQIVVVIAMVLLFRSMMRRLRADRERLTGEADGSGPTALLPVADDPRGSVRPSSGDPHGAGRAETGDEPQMCLPGDPPAGPPAVSEPGAGLADHGPDRRRADEVPDGDGGDTPTAVGDTPGDERR